MISKLLVAFASSNSPDQKSVDELLLLLQVTWPVPLDVSVELILQRVAAVLHVQFAHLKNRRCSASIKWRGDKKRDKQERRPARVAERRAVFANCDVAALFI